VNGNALEIIPELDVIFDLVFIDADKKNYLKYYDLVFEKVNADGLIIADNVLWNGKVTDVNLNKDADTKAMDNYNKKILNDERVEPLLLPLRDGLMICRKK
jgi:predicted O-methyltransferase YrrM